MSELTEKIENIITGELEDNRYIGDIAADIAAMIEAERKPDSPKTDKATKDAILAMAGKYPDYPEAPNYITVPEAVERLVEFFSEWDIYTNVTPDYWKMKLAIIGRKTTPPDYVMAIENGETPEAVTVALEDMFVTILTGGES